jgi:hypothetical protein
MAALTADTGFPIEVTPNSGIKSMIFYGSTVSATEELDVSSYFKHVLFFMQFAQASDAAGTGTMTDTGFMSTGAGTTITIGTGPSAAPVGVWVMGFG